MRRIVEDQAFTKEVERIGAELVDLALSTIMDGLYRDPRGFNRFEHEEFSFMYAKTHPIDDVPAFTVIFILDEDDNVCLKLIEEDVGF